MSLFQVEVCPQESLEDVLRLVSSPISNRVPAEEQTRKDSVVGHYEAAPLTVSDPLILVLVVTHENQVRLVAVVERISDEAKEALAELSFAHSLQASEVEQ